MSGISKLAGISLLAVLILSICLVSLPTVHSQSTQLVSKLQIANNVVTQANATVMDAEKAGANVTDLIVRLNDVTCVLAKAENNYQTGQFIVADSQLDSTIRLARELTASAQNAKQTALASNLNVSLQTAAFTAIGSSIFILALSMVWLWLKRKDEPTLKLYKNKFIFLAVGLIGLLLIATPALYRIWPGNLISTESSFLIFFLLTGIPIAISAAYGIIIVIYFNKNPKGLCRPSFHNCLTGNFEPLVSVVVATHNEETIISKKIDNVLSSDYAANKIEIIFVDDSNDSTSTIISKAAEKFPNIHLIHFNERMGYSPSMLAGCKAAHGEIIILNNAGSFMDISCNIKNCRQV